MAIGCSVTTATSRISVRPAIRMSSAISFGVFCRLAPSTRAIMRSRNVSPGSEVIRTTIRSDSTTVPPVTALRSPPDSRITGADSPVIADSSTTAIPSVTSPSPGMTCPAVTTQSLIVSVGVGTGAGDHVVQDADYQSGRHEECHHGGDEDDVSHVGLLEPFRLEHRDAQVDEHRDGDGEEQAFSDGHGPTRPLITCHMAVTNVTPALA